MKDSKNILVSCKIINIKKQEFRDLCRIEYKVSVRWLAGGKEMNSKKEQLVRAVVFVSTVSSILIANLTLGYYIGKLLDTYLLQTPWGKIVGIILGMATAVLSIIKTVKTDFLKIKGKEDK